MIIMAVVDADNSTQLDMEEFDDAVTSMRDMVQSELISRSRDLICTKCKVQVDPMRAIIKSKSKTEPERSKMICRLCNAVATMLQRQMVWPPPAFSSLDDEQQLSFWRACKETSNDDSRFQYSKVRACLVKTLSVRKTVEDSVEHFSDFKPLSVWATEGYNVEDIKARGRSEEHAVFGLVWCFPQKRTATTCTLATVEEHIQKAEQRIKTRKNTADEDDEFDDVLEDSSSDDEPPNKKAKSSGSKKKKGSTKPAKPGNAEKKAAKAEAARKKKEHAKMVKHNTAVQTFATKALAAVMTPLMDCTMAYDTMVGSLAGRYPQNIQDSMKEHRDALAEIKAKASAVATKPKNVDQYLECDVDQKTLQAKLLSTKAVMKSFNELSRIVSR